MGACPGNLLRRGFSLLPHPFLRRMFRKPLFLQLSDVNGQHRAGLRHDDAAGCFVGPLQGYVWVLRRGAAAYDEGERQKSEFHGFEFFNR